MRDDDMDVVAFLKTVPLLAGLPDEPLAWLAEAAREQRYDSGEVISREGDEEDVLYIIASGSVDVVKGYGTPRQEKIAERHRQEVVGEMRLLENMPRFATLIARNPVVVLSVPYSQFIEVATRNPIVLSKLGTIMSGKTRQAGGDLYAELLRKHQEASALADLQRAVLKGIVPHELRTPIANVMLTLELMHRVDPTTLPPDRLREMLGTLDRNIRSLRQRVDCIVDYTTLIGDQEQMFRREVNFAELARESARGLEPQAAEAGVTLEQKIIAESLLIQGDGNRLTDAMSHLLDNAVKFNRPGGLAVVTVWQEGNTARYEVTDTGVGIPADKLEYLWEPFTQMAGVLKRGLEGLGLGLALTRYIVRAHGGDVWSESEMGGGSKFGFWVPKILEAERL
jgi:signal transduction histidine kinase